MAGGWCAGGGGAIFSMLLGIIFQWDCEVCARRWFWGDQLRSGKAEAWTAASPNSLQLRVALIHSQSITPGSTVATNVRQQSKNIWCKKIKTNKSFNNPSSNVFFYYLYYCFYYFLTLNTSVVVLWGIFTLSCLGLRLGGFRICDQGWDCPPFFLFKWREDNSIWLFQFNFYFLLTYWIVFSFNWL